MQKDNMYTLKPVFIRITDNIIRIPKRPFCYKYAPKKDFHTNTYIKKSVIIIKYAKHGSRATKKANCFVGVKHTEHY